MVAGLAVKNPPPKVGAAAGADVVTTVPKPPNAGCAETAAILVAGVDVPKL